jgi:hypothetical protein
MSSGLCKYKDILGKPNTGIHQYRIFNIAILDVASVILAGYLISKYFKTNIYYTLAFLFVAGIIIHRLFCVRTTVDKLLFPNAD